MIMSQQRRCIRLMMNKYSLIYLPFVTAASLSTSYAFHHHHRHHHQIRSTKLHVLCKQSVTVSPSLLYSMLSSDDQSNIQVVVGPIRPRMYTNTWFARKVQQVHNERQNKSADDDEFKEQSRAMKFWQSSLLREKFLTPILIATSLLLFFYPGVASASEAAMTTATTTAIAATTMSQAGGGAPITILSCPVSAATEIRLMIRLLYAALLGTCLGKERSVSRHSAGVRTMSLVSMGACCFTICSCYGFSNFARVDVSRMASNVASGVGFIGAGVITTSGINKDGQSRSNPQNNIVHGLTTAATIWLSAAVGVSCGVGLLRIATTAAFATICILRMGRKKPNTADRQKQRSILRNADDEYDEDDEDEDINAEIHVTGVWDEHPHHRESKKEDQKTCLQQLEEPNQKELRTNNREATSSETTNQSDSSVQNSKFGASSVSNSNSNSSQSSSDELFQSSMDTLKDPSELMEEVVRSAWQNDNKTKSHLADLESVEQRRECVSKRRSSSKGDDSSSSNPEYLP